MAQGYDNQTPTRSSFAFQPAAPSQSRPGPTANPSNIQIVGGQSQGGVVTAGPQTNIDAGADAGLGAFFGQLMEPYVARKQHDAFAAGMTTAASGQAIEEITHPDSPVMKIFGPTAYDRGAEAYTAKTAVAQWYNAMAGDDELKKLPPDELAKVLSASWQNLRTKDPFVNTMIDQDIVQAWGPLTETVSKKRAEWQQTGYVTSMASATGAAGDALQKIAVDQMRLSGPKASDHSAVDNAANFSRVASSSPMECPTKAIRRSSSTPSNQRRRRATVMPSLLCGRLVLRRF